MMRKKLRAKNNGVVPVRYRNCFAALDAKRFEIARPSGPNDQQREAYNSYYGCHNLAFQIVVSPDGLIVNYSGPHAGSNNDLNVLADSELLADLRSALRDANMDGVELDLIADKIYNINARGVVSIRQRRRNLIEIDEDKAASAIRLPAEWKFGKITLHFPFINVYFMMKINEREVGTFINVAALLTNLHTCLYGSKCGKYFSNVGSTVYPPTLEEYMDF
jgi:hypothetical protein